MNLGILSANSSHQATAPIDLNDMKSLFVYDLLRSSSLEYFVPLPVSSNANPLSVS
jgi:hypothetical protein